MNYDEFLALMQEKYTELTGASVDAASDIGIRMKVLAGELAALSGELANLQAQAFAQTAGGEFLDMHAETRAVNRKPALKAVGELVFSREYPAGYDIAIPAGVLCSSRQAPQIHVETMAEAVLAAGETSVAVMAEAITAGAAANAAANEICLMITGAQGISAVNNPAAFTGGSDAESDEMLRARLLKSYRNISNTTNAAFYYDMAMSENGVVSANVLPRKRGRGTVDVVIACSNEIQSTETAARLGDKLAHEKEINVSVEVHPAIKTSINLTVEIAVGEDIDFELAATACEQCIAKYIGTLAVGEALLLARLGRELLSVDGVYNYSITSPLADVSTGAEYILSAGSITVERMIS